MNVNLLKLSLLMILLGGAGGAVGSMAGNVLGRGGVLGGGLVGGSLLVVVAGFLAAQRLVRTPPLELLSGRRETRATAARSLTHTPTGP